MIKQLTAMPKYEAYKDSGMEWLGEIPVHWNQLPMCVISSIKSITNVQDYELLSVYLELGVIKFSDVDAKRTNVTSQDLSKYQLVSPGDFVLNNQQAWRGSVGVSQYKGIVSPAYLVLKLAPSIDPKFSNYLFRNGSMVSQYLVCSKGVGTIQRNLYWPQLRRIPVCFPPLHEQTAITSFLDRKTAQIDQAVAIKEKQIALLKERKQILIQNAVTRGLNPNVPMRDSGVEWIGEIPEHWRINRLKFLSEIRYGLGQPPRELDKGFPLIRATNIERGKISEKGLIYVDPTNIPWDRNPILKENDIIVVRSGAYTGDSAIVPKQYDGAIAGYDMVMKPVGINPKYLALSMLAQYVLYEQLYLLRMRSAQPHLNAEELGETLIICPSPEVQIAIVAHIEAESAKIDQAITIQQQQIDKLKEYKATLINSAVTGKIKVPEFVEGRVAELTEAPMPEPVEGELVEDGVA